MIAGPANSGKVELLLDRYLASLDGEPVLIVPNRSDVESVSRDLLRRRPALLGGSIDTFDDVFERVAYAGGDARPLLSPAQRALLVRQVLGSAPLNGLAASARFGGFADELLRTLGELESGLLDPNELEGELAGVEEPGLELPERAQQLVGEAAEAGRGGEAVERRGG